MIRGAPASILLHAAVIGAGYIVWPYVGTTVVDSEFVVVPVELVDVGEMTNVAPIVTPQAVEEPEEEPVPEEPEEPEEELPVEDEPDERDIPEDDIETATEAPPPEQEDDVIPELDKEAPKEEEKPKPEDPKPEQPKTPNPKPKSNPLDDFLKSNESTFDSERETKKRTQQARSDRKKPDEASDAQETRKGAGERTANTVRIEQLLFNQIVPCWGNVLDLPEPERLNVSLKAKLDAEGNLITVQLVQPSRRPIGDRAMGVAIDRALLAVRKCEPFRLPRDDYDLWKETNINLGPRFSGR
ncbi:hypothetical protein [Henriciella litoralis]|uniref:hypothetical protein n=1 Tax=Henriciella litoralis TaxID=568102 RepID=UPI000A05D459|nr:hypothetical protein [Henriciella litoralis]